MQTELAFTAPWKHETTFALGFQSTKQSVKAGLPKSRLLAGVNSSINQRASVGIEHFRDTDYKTTECAGTACGTGKKGHTTTIRFSLSF